MPFIHEPGTLPPPSDVELGRGMDGVVIEVLDHPELVLKTMHFPGRLSRNRVALELRVLEAVPDATDGLGATQVFNHGVNARQRSWLVRERVFDVEPRGRQSERTALLRVILEIYPVADVSPYMLPDPTFDNVRWGFTQANAAPRWILIDP